jgi:type IV pilus assembly protein PilQ
MKIRLAINSDFVTRKIRGAAYGILLLLTFFVPQFAKTQDQLNAAKTAQAAAAHGVALEQKPAGTSFGKSEETYAVTATALNTDSAALQANRPVAEEIPAASRLVPVAEIAALLKSAVQSITASPLQETARFSESPFEAAKLTAVSAAAQPVQIASLAPAALPIIQPGPQTIFTYEVFPAAQAASNTGFRFTGEHITMDAVDVPLVDFFRAMAEIADINIMLDPAIKGVTTFKVKKLPWDQLFDMVMLNHGLAHTVEGTLIRVTLKKTLQEEAKQREDLRKANMLAGETDTRVRRLNYAKAAELKSILEKQITQRGTIVVDERTNSLVLNDLPDSLDRLFKLFDLLDIAEPQVEIETRIVSSTRNFSRDIGVQFGFVQGNGNRVTVGGGNPNYLQGGSRPMGDTGTSSNSPGVSPGGSDTSGGNLNVNLPANTAFGGIGISVGNIIDTFLLDAAITAGESKGWAKMISQPKVTAQNNAPAVITNGVRIPVQVIQDNTVTIQYFDAALTLTATPQITYDGNIMLNLNVTNNKADFGNTSAGGVPTIRTNETSTSIMVSDGGTAMLGGIFVEDDSSNEDRVPGLGSLPLIGNLFRRTGTVRDTQEITFFVTPRIHR